MTDARRDDAGNPLGDDRLLSAVRGGDSNAYALLYERHAAAARGLARQLVRGEAEVDDAVSEAFAGVLEAVRKGGGPRHGFRAYLLASVRNACHDRARGERRQIVTDDLESFDPGTPFVDPAVEGLERSLIARAFLSLPQRWQAVLWHTEIEGEKPAAVAGVLGMSSNSVAALAYRAREGLRQAYLQMHLADGSTAESCRPTLDQLGAYVRGGLAKRVRARVEQHLGDCPDCRAVRAELAEVNVGLRGVVAPLLIGPVAADYLAVLSGGESLRSLWGYLAEHPQQAAAEGGTVTMAAASVALALVSVQITPPSDPRVPPAAVGSALIEGSGGPGAPASLAVSVPSPALSGERSGSSLPLSDLAFELSETRGPSQAAQSARRRCLAVGGTAPPEGGPSGTRGTAASTWWRLPVVPVFQEGQGSGVLRGGEDCEWADPEEGEGSGAGAPPSTGAAPGTSSGSGSSAPAARPAGASAGGAGAAPPAASSNASSGGAEPGPPHGPRRGPATAGDSGNAGARQEDPSGGNRQGPGESGAGSAGRVAPGHAPRGVPP